MMNLVDIQDGLLHCPQCGSNGMSQHDVAIFMRGGKHNKGWITAATNKGSIIKTSAKMDKNPSMYADGIRITFSCEVCDFNKPTFTLTIGHHKGVTQVEWEESKKAKAY